MGVGPPKTSLITLAYGSFTYPWRAFHRKYFSKAILAA
jgi:hypothetical protein